MLAIAACGGGGTPVLVKGFRFQPRSASVAVGETITWTQTDNTIHTITAGTPGRPSGAFDHQDFGQGESFSFTFERAGDFPYFCSIHPEGMRGEVKVG